MKKLIGITCDHYKISKFRKGLLREGYKLEYDGKSGVKDVHLFRIEVDEKDYNDELEKIGKIVKKLNFESNNSN